MKTNYKELFKEEIQPGIFRIWIFDERNGSKNFFMRIFEILPGKWTKEDSHPYEHEIFVLQGKGEVKIGNKLEEIKEEDALFIPPNYIHMVKNTGDDILRFICLVPSSYRKYKEVKG